MVSHIRFLALTEQETREEYAVKRGLSRGWFVRMNGEREREREKEGGKKVINVTIFYREVVYMRAVLHRAMIKKYNVDKRGP